MSARLLPLGVDIGATRVRVVEAELCGTRARVRAVAVRDVPAGSSSSGTLRDAQYVGAIIEDAVVELGTRQRRCVCGIGEPDAMLRTLMLPKMTAVERERAARFEAERHIDYPVDEALVRLHRVDASGTAWVLGICRKSAIVTRSAALRAAGLKPVAMDHEACALARAFAGFDAVVDMGHHRTSLHVTTGHAPLTLQVCSGGADVTRAIERELAVDEQTAEKRKRILGTSGAGERSRAALASDVAALVRSARPTHAIKRIALVGNAARLPGIASDLETATGSLCEVPVSETLHGERYPEDVIRSSAPDWTLAAALAAWGAA